MVEFPGVQGSGIEGQASLYIRIAALLTVPIMLVISGTTGKKTAEVSHKYNLIITPPGPFFAIWGIIYLGLITSGVYSVVNNTWSLGVTVLFGVVNILNALWVYVFSFSSTKTNNICTALVILMAILNQLQWIWMEAPAGLPSDVSSWNIANRNIFSFYQGWLVAASNLNLGVTLVYTFGIPKKIHTFVFWIMCPSCIIGMILLNLSYQNGFENNIAMYFSAVYALIGAYISTKRNYQKDESSYVQFIKQK